MHRGKRLIPFLLLAPERNISCDIFEIRFSESHGCFCPCSHATRGQSCRELRRNRSHLWRAPTDNVLETETSSSDVDEDEFAVIISSPALQRGGGEPG